MTLVLAFGAQGIADALTLSKTSGNHQTKKRGETFSITLRITDLLSTDLSDLDDDGTIWMITITRWSALIRILRLTTTSKYRWKQSGNSNRRIIWGYSSYTRTLNYRVNRRLMHLGNPCR